MDILSALPENIEINDGFENVIESVKNLENVLLTGKAGTGKSTLLNYLFRTNTVQGAIVLAPTGVAAINVGGMTVHRFFSFRANVTLELVSSSDYYPGKFIKEIKNLKTLIIDEISMLRADLLDCLELSLRRFGPKEGHPFGGVQMIFVGDLLQLPPVVKGEERDYLNHKYETPYFFSSDAFKSVQFKLLELTKVYRQEDEDFINVLNAVRTNTVTESDIQFLNEHLDEEFEPDKSEFFITLTTTNAKADSINETNLESLDTPIEVAEAKIVGTVEADEYPTSKLLIFKEGSQIMTLNNDPEDRWVNGSVGVIEEVNLEANPPYLRVKLMHSGRTETMERYSWEIQRPSFSENRLKYEFVGSFSQFPFRLAWAVTIHKSQGKTFQNVILDLKPRVFAEGQLYVALSRCTSIDGLVLRSKVSTSQIIVDERVVEFLHNY